MGFCYDFGVVFLETKNCVFRENDVLGLGMGRGCYRKGGYE